MQDQEKDGILNGETRRMMSEKILEPNRRSARRQALPFFQHVFAEHPHLIPSIDEFKRLSQARNEITHTGRMQLSGLEREYSNDLHRIHCQLRSLVEGVILGLLEEHADLLEDDWRRVRGSDLAVY